MIKNYIKLAWRKIKTDKMFSILNILGLSIGLAITALLYLFISQQRSFDDMYSQKDHIYRALLHTSEAKGGEVWCSVPAAFGSEMKKEIPEVKYQTRMLRHGFGTTAFIEANNRNFTEKRFFWCDTDFFKIFDVPFLKGNKETALSRPNTVVLSETIAHTYFGNEDPVGKTINLDNNQDLEVTGVFRDFSTNSTIHCNVIGSFSSTGNFYTNPSWSNASFETYFLLNNHAEMSAINIKIKKLIDKNVAGDDQWYSLSLQPLSRVHLYSSGYTDSYSDRNGSIQQIRNLSLLAVIILIIACINYMNLTTARSQKRTKDVGINKTMGASTKNLILRFYTETGLITLIAIFFGIILALAGVPLFNRITNQHLHYNQIFSVQFLGSLLIIWLVTTAVAGSYPALHLSRFSPKRIMNPSYTQGNFTGFIRKGLVILQFSASVILIVGVIIVHQQLKFIQNKNLGYNPENVIAISTAGIRNSEAIEALSNGLKNLASVSEVSLAQGYPGQGVSGRSLYKTNDKIGLPIQTNRADASIVNALDLKLLAGHSLPKVKAESDSIVDVVLNKKAVDFLGYTPREAIGRKVDLQLGDNAYIVGVVDNFNYASLHEPVGAYAFNNAQMEPRRFMLVRMSSSNLSNTLSQFQEIFKKVIPDSAFEYTFLDKNLEKMYASEQQTARIGYVFSILAIFVACLGLFGLAAFTAEQRSKEIGIRKVVGASVFAITRLLSIDFLKLVFISLVLGFPIALYLMNSWLQGFAYRVDISWLVFLLSGGIALFVALLTVSFQAIKAAIANPVKSLRSE